jgi:hypothetical protein
MRRIESIRSRESRLPKRDYQRHQRGKPRGRGSRQRLEHARILPGRKNTKKLHDCTYIGWYIAL